MDDWTDDILRSIVGHPSPEDAAMASAAAWLTCGNASAAAVILFLGESTYIIAHGFRDDDAEIEVSVGRADASVASLLDDRSIIALTAEVKIDRPELLLRFPDRLAAIAVAFADDRASADNSEPVELTTEVCRRILSRASSRQCLIADPQHMETVAEFSAGAGHEVNNPLGSIIGQTQLLLKRTDRADFRESLETIGSQAWRIRDMIGDSMLFARPTQPELQRCDITETVRAAAEQVRANCNLTDGELHLNLPASGLQVEMDPVQISVLLMHLLRNAADATHSQDVERCITVELSVHSDYAVCLAIDDNGPGITHTPVRQHLFDPFFSGRQAGRGLGFGLCHCWQIVRQHNGLLLQQNLLPHGCRFMLCLPHCQR